MPSEKGRFEVSVFSSWGQRTDSSLSLEVLPGPLWGSTTELPLSMEKKIQNNLQAGIWWPSRNPTPVSPQVPDPDYSDNCFLKPHLQEVMMVG